MTLHREPLNGAVAELEDLYAELAPSRSTSHWPATPANSPPNMPCTATTPSTSLAPCRLRADDILLATWDNALNAAARETGQLLANDTD